MSDSETVRVPLQREHSDRNRPGEASSCGRSFGPVGYVLLWFPLSSETFIFREVKQLREKGLPVRVYTVYGRRTSGQSLEMLSYDGPIERMGLPTAGKILGAFFRAYRKDPLLVRNLLKRYLFRRMRNLESQGENLLCFFAGFLLAEQIRRDGISLLHAPWGNGPATAAAVASRLVGIPFAFTGRAGDIYPEDGLLAEKARQAVFIRTNNRANVSWLQQFCPAGQKSKIHLIYNSLTLSRRTECLCPCTPPCRVLAIGRFARTKGFPYLITAMARLKREHFPVHLTLVGGGSYRRRLLRQIKELGLQDDIDLPGFIPNDRILQYMENHDMLVVPSVVYDNGDRDGIPNVIMEALSNAMPVIATDVCGIGEVIRPGETGLLIRQRDATAIAEAVRWTAGHRNQALAMARRGRELVFQMFDAEKNIDSLYRLYAGAVSDRS